MKFKKFAIPAILATGILLTGCADKDETKPTDEKPVETEVTTEVEDTETDTTEDAEEVPAESDAVEDENNENAAVSIFLTYFDGVSEEDTEKIKSVYNDEVSAESFEELFASYDIKTEVESYEVVSQEETVWTFDAKVKFMDESGQEGYNNNLSAYEIKVDTATGKITYLEITGTQDL